VTGRIMESISRLIALAPADLIEFLNGDKWQGACSLLFFADEVQESFPTPTIPAN